MDKDSEKKRILKLLLETYSIEEIKDIFQRIDSRIIDLMKFSSNDFIEINKALKSTYNNVKNIEETSLTLFDKEKWSLNQRAITLLKDSKKTFDIQKEIIKEIRKTYTEINELSAHNIPIYLISIKNLKQNISSLLLWMSNHILEIEHSEKENSVRIQQATDLSNALKAQQKIIDEKSVEFKNLQKEIKLIKTSLFKEIEINLDQKKFKTFGPAENEKHSIHEAVTKNKTCVSDIVTNLQYHDIVRQKVEHIQEIHNDIIDELDLIEKQKNTSNIHTKVKYFLQIRDISGLQAAQLFHVNKDYQQAIKTITTRLIELSENLLAINKTCKTFTENKDNSYEHIYLLLEQYTEIVKDWRKITDGTFLWPMEQSADISKKIVNVFTQTKGLQDIFNQFNDLEIKKEARIQLGDILNTLKENLTENLTFSQSFALISKKTEKLLELYRKFSNNINEIQVIPELVAQLQQRTFEINLKFQEITESAIKLSGEFDTIVDNISYYEYFDEVIEMIIDELNTINLQLLEDDIELDESRKQENLEYIRKKYTMQSERDILEQTINSEIAVSEASDEEDDDDVEFF